MMFNENNLYINDRDLFLYDNIDNQSVGKLSYSLLELIKSDDNKDKKEKDYERKPINIYINTFGGSVYDMWGLIDIIITSKTPIYTHCLGYAMSAGFQIFLAGHKRFVHKHSTLMYHQLSSNLGYEDFQSIEEKKEQLAYLQEQIEKFVLSRTRIDKQVIDNVRETKKDLFFTSDEAIKYGIADEVININM